MTKSPTLSAEAMLKAIIEAQVKGGHEQWDYLIDNKGRLTLRFHDDPAGCHLKENLLGILLDPAGLRAAYGDYPSNTAHGFFSDGDLRIQKVIPQWTTNSHKILDAWLSIPSGDALGAIRTAYELLPSNSER